MDYSAGEHSITLKVLTLNFALSELKLSNRQTGRQEQTTPPDDGREIPLKMAARSVIAQRSSNLAAETRTTFDALL